MEEAGNNTTVGEAEFSREKQARNWGDYGSKPPSRGKASDIRIVCAGPSLSRSQLTRCTPSKASLFGQMRAVTANHFPSQSSSNVDVLTSPLNVDSRSGNPERSSSSVLNSCGYKWSIKEGELKERKVLALNFPAFV